MKTVAVSENTWRKLRELKEKMGFQSYNELINALIEKWHLASVREEISKINVGISYREAGEFMDVVKRGKTQSPVTEVKDYGGEKPGSK